MALMLAAIKSCIWYLDLVCVLLIAMNLRSWLHAFAQPASAKNTASKFPFSDSLS